MLEGLARHTGAEALYPIACDAPSFPDDVEVIYLYDRVDDCFGYAVNLDWPDGSEWGYAPFGR